MSCFQHAILWTFLTIMSNTTPSHLFQSRVWSVAVVIMLLPAIITRSGVDFLPEKEEADDARSQKLSLGQSVRSLLAGENLCRKLRYAIFHFCFPMIEADAYPRISHKRRRSVPTRRRFRDLSTIFAAFLWILSYELVRRRTRRFYTCSGRSVQGSSHSNNRFSLSLLYAFFLNYSMTGPRRKTLCRQPETRLSIWRRCQKLRH